MLHVESRRQHSGVDTGGPRRRARPDTRANSSNMLLGETIAQGSMSESHSQWHKLQPVSFDRAIGRNLNPNSRRASIGRRTPADSVARRPDPPCPAPPAASDLRRCSGVQSSRDPAAGSHIPSLRARYAPGPSRRYHLCGRPDGVDHLLLELIEQRQQNGSLEHGFLNKPGRVQGATCYVCTRGEIFEHPMFVWRIVRREGIARRKWSSVATA